MGFTVNRVTRALLATHNDPELAMNWLFENAENPGISTVLSLEFDKPLQSETQK
jgi:uncharacterized UBP type Zn finger protein